MNLSFDNQTYKALLNDAKLQGISSKELAATIIKEYYSSFTPDNQTSLKEDIKKDTVTNVEQQTKTKL